MFLTRQINLKTQFGCLIAGISGDAPNVLLIPGAKNAKNCLLVKVSIFVLARAGGRPRTGLARPSILSTWPRSPECPKALVEINRPVKPDRGPQFLITWIVLVCLILFKNEEEKFKTFSKMKSIPVNTLSDGFYLMKISYQMNEIFTPRRIQFLQTKYEVNIEIHTKCPEKGSDKYYVPLKRKFAKTLCILLSNEPLTSRSIMEKFQIIQDRKKLSLDYVCNVTKGCKYTTNIKLNFQQGSALGRTVFRLSFSMLKDLSTDSGIAWYP